MGASASIQQPPPFETVEAALMAGIPQDEIDAWYKQAMDRAAKWNYTVSDAKWAEIKAAYAEANANGDDVASMYEVALFQLLSGNVFLQD